MNLDDNPYAAPKSDLSAPAVEWMQSDPGGHSKTALGLSLVYFGIIFLLLSLILSVGAAAIPPLLIVTFGGIIISAIMMFIGPLFCLSVPAETEAKGLIIGSVVFQFINLVWAVGAQFGFSIPGAEAVGQIFGLVSAVLFVLFMRKLSMFIGRQDLAASAKNVLVLAVVTVAAAILFAAAMFVVGPIAGMLFLVVGIMGLVVFVMYANLVNNLRKALKSN